MDGVITMRDRLGESADVNFSNVADLTALQNARGVLAPLSNAAPYIEKLVKKINVAGTGGGTFDSAEISAKLKFTKADGKVISMTLPTPADTLFEGVADVGTRVIQTQGDAIATAISTAVAGLTLTFKEGKYHAKRKFMKV